MLILRDIADSVDPNLKFTIDCPSQNGNGRLPVLDLQFWVEGGTLLRHAFFKKPMAPERTIMAGSAISQRVKRDTLFAEGMRRLSAMDNYTTREERNLVLGTFLNGMRISGYGQPIRQDILQGILARDRALRTGSRYRTRAEIMGQKAARDDKYLNTWFLRGTTTSVLKVQPTPGGLLAQHVRNKIGKLKAPDGGTTKVVEGAGRGIMAGLRQPDPGIKPGCQFGGSGALTSCLIDSKQTCWQSRLVYALKCTKCPATYVGTTGLTAHRRSQEHQQALRRGDETYAIAKHYLAEHPGEEGDTHPFTFKILGGAGINGNLQRYITEALRIREAKEAGETLLNSKGEWARVALKCLVVAED